MLKYCVSGLLLWIGCMSTWASARVGRDSLELPIMQSRLQQDSIVALTDGMHVGGLDEDTLKALVQESIVRVQAQQDTLLTIQIPQMEPKTFTPDPIRSFWLSLILPGAGQIYNHKYWKLPIVYGGFLGCVYALSWNGQMLKDYTQAYLDIMDDDPNTKSYEKMLPMGYDIKGKEERFKEIFKRKKNYYRKYRDMSIFAFAGVYLISVVDAYVDAELSSFDISRDLSLRWEPTLLNGDNKLAQRLGVRSLGVDCSLSF